MVDKRKHNISNWKNTNFPPFCNNKNKCSLEMVKLDNFLQVI